MRLTPVVADRHTYYYILPRFREHNKQFHTGPELSDGNSDLTLVQVNALSELNPSEAIVVHSLLLLPLPQKLARPCRCSHHRGPSWITTVCAVRFA